MTVPFQVQPRMPASWPGATPTAEVVTWFLAHVRVTGDRFAANQIMAPLVRCHQMASEATETIERTPSEYARHVQEMLTAFGPFRFTVTELLTDGDRVYLRWQQDGHHLSELEGWSPTGSPLRDVGSAVYRVADGRIAEYWIQLDRLGLKRQLSAAANLAAVHGHPDTPTQMPNPELVRSPHV